MPLQTFLAALIFSIVMAFTPGPNNVMLAASGARFGVARTLPHAAGVTVGFPVMLSLVGLGLASILLASPLLQLVMKAVSCAYLLWLAAQIARSTSAMSDTGKARPLNFLQAAAFQWINPKAWLMAVGAISAYTAGRGRELYLQVAIIAAITLVVSVGSTLTWTSFGAGIRRWLRSPAALRLFNLAMALLLFASTVPILLEIADGLRK
ncbi:MAG: LysE family translocator [Alphaproteobacteria bacterium]|nr:LysE family translocator [Alphaproteobacteria bacterium]